MPQTGTGFPTLGSLIGLSQDVIIKSTHGTACRVPEPPAEEGATFPALLVPLS